MLYHACKVSHTRFHFCLKTQFWKRKLKQRKLFAYTLLLISPIRRSLQWLLPVMLFHMMAPTIPGRESSILQDEGANTSNWLFPSCSLLHFLPVTGEHNECCVVTPRTLAQIRKLLFFYAVRHVCTNLVAGATLAHDSRTRAIAN